jgi:hypothetical protein
MMKKLISISLVALLLYVCGAMPSLTIAQSRQGESLVEKVKADVAKRGVGKNARVTVKLEDGSKLKGYVSQAGEDSFTLTDSKTGQTRTLMYGDVTEVKKQGGLSLAAKIGIGLGIAVGVLALLYGIACGNDAFC